jgi:CBS domain-containing protein
MTKLVRDLMHPGFITCQANVTLGQVATLLHQQHVHALIVVDRDGRPLGVISDFDLLAGEWLAINNESTAVMRKMTAGEMMTTPIATIEADTPMMDAVRRMRSQDISRLLVTERGKAIGMLSISDLVAYLAQTAPLKRDTVADVMSRAILVCRDSTPVEAAARAMTEAHFRSVLVVNAAGKPLGIANGLDLLAACEDETCHGMVVAQVMHPALTIHPNASLREAADLMIQHHHHRLVVVDTDDPDTMPLGVISSYDIVAEMARADSVWQQGK